MKHGPNSTGASGAFGVAIVTAVFTANGRRVVLAPPLTAIRQLESRAHSRYLAHGPVSLAALEAHFRLAARRWPGIADLLHDRLGQAVRWAGSGPI